MHHHAAIGQRIALVLSASAEQQGPHGRRLPDANRAHGAADILHGIIHREARRNHTTRTIDVEGDILVGVLAFQEQQLGANQRRHLVKNRAGQEDDAFLEQAGIDVESPFPTRGLFDHHGHQGVVIDIYRITVPDHHLILSRQAGRLSSLLPDPACGAATRQRKSHAPIFPPGSTPWRSARLQHHAIIPGFDPRRQGAAEPAIIQIAAHMG